MVKQRLATSIYASVLFTILGAIAWGSGQPFLFPSLGPSAFILAFDRCGKRTRTYRIVGSHCIGTAAGWIAYTLLGSGVATTITQGAFSGSGFQLALSGTVSIALTSWGMIATNTNHPPACATTLIVSLGLLSTLIQVATIIGAIVIAIVATVGVTAVFAVLSDTIPFIGFLTPLVLVGGLVIAFFPMYYRFPDADVHWKHVLPGVVFAAVGWAVFQSLFQVYLAATGGDSENFFGGVIVIVTWLYFSGLILLLGAVINAVLGGYASGAAGGVGQGAATDETTRTTGDSTTYEETLNRQETAEYLKALREDLTGRYEDMRPTTTETGADQRPQPAGEIKVVEQAQAASDGDGDSDEQEWTVSLRWRATVDESGGHSGSADD